MNRLCYFIVAVCFPRMSFPLWMLERAARHHFGGELGP